MKDIKSYAIGFLTCACLFLIMGQTYTWDDAYAKVIKNQSMEGNWEIEQIQQGNSSITFFYDKNKGRVFQYYTSVIDSDEKIATFIKVDILTQEEAQEKYKK